MELYDRALGRTVLLLIIEKRPQPCKAILGEPDAHGMILGNGAGLPRALDQNTYCTSGVSGERARLQLIHRHKPDHWNQNSPRSDGAMIREGAERVFASSRDYAALTIACAARLASPGLRRVPFAISLNGERSENPTTPSGPKTTVDSTARNSSAL